MTKKIPLLIVFLILISYAESTFIYYSDFFAVDSALTKLTDNHGEGREDLYGTRNFRVILHGVAYRGGGHNYGNATNPRDNKNPLPYEGLENLLAAGFSKSIYLYSTNFDTAHQVIVNDFIDDTLQYQQISGNSLEEQDTLIRYAFEAINSEDVGPIYYHCWNGWHQSGYISAILLKQFCGYSTMKSIHYWEDATDNWNRGYDRIKDAIQDFEPLPQYSISDGVSEEICPCYDDPRENDTVETIDTDIKSVNDTILFPSGSSLLLPELTTFLDEYAQRLNNSPYFNIEIAGHTDSEEDSETNEYLSLDRAKAVYQYLVDQGVDSTTLTYRGYGESELIHSCDESHDCSNSDHAQNRRVVFNITSIAIQIRYELNSTQVPQSYKDILRESFAILAKDTTLHIEIQGYSSRDSVETEYVETNMMVNQNISERRASNTFNFLRDIGFNMNNVTFEGYGWTEDMEYNNESDRKIIFVILENN